MGELFIGFYQIVVAAMLGRWADNVDAGKISPISVSLFYFLFAMVCIIGFRASTTTTLKMFYTAFGCNMVLISYVYLITNDHEKYHREAGAWISCLMGCFMVTAILTLVMDYSNTKTLLIYYLLGIASFCVPQFFKRRSARREKD